MAAAPLWQSQQQPRSPPQANPFSLPLSAAGNLLSGASTARSFHVDGGGSGGGGVGAASDDQDQEDEERELLGRLDVTLGIIEREYAAFNASHASGPAGTGAGSGARKQRRVVPHLFYAFYRSELCHNFLCAVFRYLMLFARAPVQPGEKLDGSGPDSARGAMHDSNLGGKKLRALQAALQRVAQTWAAILMYRAEMNRFETITVAAGAGSASARSAASGGRHLSMKRSEHFLNDSFDNQFFETLFLLVEYAIEARFLDQTRPIAAGGASGSGGSDKSVSIAAATAASASGSTTGADPLAAARISSEAGKPVAPVSAAVVAPVATAAAGKGGKSSTASAALLAQQVESTWRVAQHELQRILRSRNFFAATRRRKNPAFGPQDSGNGLVHVPLSTSALQSAAGGQSARRASAAAVAAASSSAASSAGGSGVSKYPGRTSASYRSPATFRLSGPGGAPVSQFRSWDPSDPSTAFGSSLDDTDDTRALSHLPGHFRTRNSFGILDCLDLRSPIVASVLPNPRLSLSLRGSASNETYVFGAEARRGVGPSGLPRTSARLTHAEEKYLAAQHRIQQQRALEWRLRQEREEQEQLQKQEQADEETTVAIGEQQQQQQQKSDVHEQSQEEKQNDHPGSNTNDAAAVGTIPPLPLQTLQLQSRSPTLTSTAALVPGSTPSLLPVPPPRGSSGGGSLSARSHGGPARRAHFVDRLSPRTARAHHLSGTGHTSARGGGGNGSGGPLHKVNPLDYPGAPPPPRSARKGQRLTLDEALNCAAANQPVQIVRVEGNRISLADFYPTS